MNKLLQTTLTLTNIVLYLVMLALWIAIPDEFWLNFFLSAFNVLLSCLLAFVCRKELIVYLKSSVFKGLSAAVSGAILIFCILGLINFIAYKTPKAWDFTYAGLNSLTSQTSKILDSIKEPIKVKIFATQERSSAIKGLVELYRLEKNDIEISSIDPELRPDEVERFGITQNQTLVIQIGDRHENVTEPSELKITNALLKLTRESDPEVCLVQGHGEINVDKKGDEGYTYVAQLLKNSSYQLKKIMTAGQEEIPKSCETTLLMGPTQGLKDKEVDMLEDYLEQGGGLIVALGPNFNEDPHSYLREMLKRWGIDLRNDLVIDKSSHVSGSDGTVPMVQRFPQVHSIVKNFEGVVFFPLVSSIHEVPSSEDVKYSPLARSSVAPESWAESSTEQIISGKAIYDEQDDVAGPVTLAAAVESADPDKGRLVVFGNANMLMNAYSNYGKNFILYLNSLSWVSHEDRLIAFDTPQIEDVPVFISSPQLGIIFYFSVVFGPLLLLGVAFLVYRRRRLL